MFLTVVKDSVTVLSNSQKRYSLFPDIGHSDFSGCHQSHGDKQIASQTCNPATLIKPNNLLYLLVREWLKKMFVNANARGHMVLLIVKDVVAGLHAPDQLSKTMVLWTRERQSHLCNICFKKNINR